MFFEGVWEMSLDFFRGVQKCIVSGVGVMRFLLLVYYFYCLGNCQMWGCFKLKCDFDYVCFVSGKKEVVGLVV